MAKPATRRLASRRTDLVSGARNAISVCLGVTADDRFLLVGDHATAEVVDALEAATVLAGAPCLRLDLESVGDRPLRHLPDEVAAEILRFAPTASAVAVQALAGELPAITALRLLLVDEAKCRHAQMAGVTRQMMEEGMAADYFAVAELASRLHGIVNSASTIHATGEWGTSLVARMTPAHRWVGGNAILREPGQWANLPAGEVATSPMTVDGLIATRVLGDQFGRYGLLAEPASFEIESGQLVGFQAPAPAGLADELREYFDQAPCSRRVGEFAIGCNTALEEPIGHLLQDEKLPGIHLAFGDPYARETGADWTCPTHVDVVASRCTVIVDDRQIMKDGIFCV